MRLDARIPPSRRRSRGRSTVTRWSSSCLSCYCQCHAVVPLPVANGGEQPTAMPTTCSRIIRIAKIEPKNCSNRAREKMKRCVIGACTEVLRRIRREQQPRADAQRLHTGEVWPHSRRAARHQSPWRRPCMEEGWWRKRDWSTMGPTGWWRGRGGGGDSSTSSK